MRRSLLALILALAAGVASMPAATTATPIPTAARGTAPSATSAAATSWESLYAARLEASAGWRRARLALRKAELALERFTKPWQPGLSVATSVAAPITVGSGGLTGGQVLTSLNLEKILGTEVSLFAPVGASSSGGLELGKPGISVSRPLFTETQADRLEAEASVMEARAALAEEEKALRTTLATGILDAVHYRRLLGTNQENVAVLEAVKAATRDTTTLRELEVRILEARKAMLVASKALESLDADLRSGDEALYKEVLGLQELWSAATGDKEPGDSPAIEALRLSLEAAQRRQAGSFLASLPNPDITATLSVDTATGDIDWGLSFSLSYDILDRGQRSYENLERSENPKILALELADARKARSTGLSSVRQNLAIFDLDRKIQDLEVAEAAEDLEILEALRREGFASEEEVVIARIDLSVEKTEAQRIEHEILLLRLELAGYYE